jgi:hypothetical protein
MWSEGQPRSRHNSLRSAFGTYSVSWLPLTPHSESGAYHFSFGKSAFFTNVLPSSGAPRLFNEATSLV